MKIFLNTTLSAVLIFLFYFTQCVGAICVSNVAKSEISKIAESDIDDGIIDGAVVIAGGIKGDDFIAEFGFADCAKKYPMNADTIVDIASITKCAATVPALLVLKSRGLVDFDAPFTKYISDYSGKFKRIPTIRELANHTSGFHGKRLYFDESGAVMMKKILTLEQPFAPSDTPVYACWNYILLSMVVERVSGESFTKFCRREIFAPLKMESSSLGKPVDSAKAEGIAQTIGTKSAGEISDFVAYRIYRDGLATGNAGMFSTARDLAKLARCILAKGKTPDGLEMFSESAFDELLPHGQKAVDGIRNFGWSLWEKEMPKSKFGEMLVHSGWSGQTMFVNFKRNRFEIVLTTRRENYGRAKLDRFKIAEIIENCPD